MKKAFTTLLLLVPVMVFSNNWEQDILAVKKAYKNVRSYSSTLEYKVFLDDQLTETTTGYVHCSNDKVHYKIDEYEVLSDGEKTLVLDHQEKVILVSNVDKSVKHSVDLDSAIKDVDHVETKELSNGQRSHKIFMNKGEFSWIELVFDAKDHSLKKIVQNKRYKEMDYDGNYRAVRLEITYLSFKKGPVKKQVFDASKFVDVEKNGAQVKLKPAYANYELVDVRKK